MHEAPAPAAAVSLFEVSVQDGKVFATWNAEALEVLPPLHLAIARTQLELLSRYAGLLAETSLLLQNWRARCRT